MPSAALPCDAQLSALALCERRHPREKDLVCKVRRKRVRVGGGESSLHLDLIQNLSRPPLKKKKALNAAAAWCLLKLRCPLEAADLEGCCGVSTKSSRTLQGPPTSVPRECQGAAARLEACLERASEEEGSEQEERKG